MIVIVRFMRATQFGRKENGLPDGPEGSVGRMAAAYAQRKILDLVR